MLRGPFLQRWSEMERRSIFPGQEYAFREIPKRKAELQRVRVIEQARDKWKVEWIDLCLRQRR